MHRTVLQGLSNACLALLGVGMAPELYSQGVMVHSRESATHGFLVLKDIAGKTIGSGELTQVPRKDRITARLLLRFRDGSIDDETTVYAQSRVFRLISDHHVQRGPSFPHALESSVDMPTGRVSVSSEKDESVKEQPPLKLPADLSNGLVLTLVKNLERDGPMVEVPYLAFGPEPRLVKLDIFREGQQRFRIAGSTFKADRYRIEIKLGGFTSLIAPILGKQPGDFRVWVATGEVPKIVRLDGAIYFGGPLWSIQLSHPSWWPWPESLSLMRCKFCLNPHGLGVRVVRNGVDLGCYT